jgi:hypothetical protein
MNMSSMHREIEVSEADKTFIQLFVQRAAVMFLSVFQHCVLSKRSFTYFFLFFF